MNVLIGLVTHPESKYLDKNFVHNISKLVDMPNCYITTQISNENLSRRIISRFDLVKYYLVSINIELKFTKYISGRQGTFNLLMNYLRKYRDVFIRIKNHHSAPDMEINQLRRFDNINLAHLEFFKTAFNHNYDFLIVLEDDALTPNPSSFRDLILQLLFDDEFSKKPAFLNASKSLSWSELNMERLISSINPHKLYSQTTLTVTNSACANIYNRKYIEVIFGRLKRVALKGLQNFIPIDQLLNYVTLMDQRGEKEIVSFHMAQLIFDQLSLYSKG